MAAVIAVFLIWWWQVFTRSARALDGKTAIVMIVLVALPVIFFLFAVHSASGERDYFRSAKLTFANLRFDLPGPGGALQAGLTCRNCGAPVEYKEARDIVIRCSHCQTQLLIPSVLLSDRLQDMFKKGAPAQRARRIMVVRAMPPARHLFSKQLGACRS